ncbi:MAG: cobyrinate a,c-diamide synthase [Alphaproteobacteria bacterium]|nr:cobyrinate a,c-diamide synthase [Alphaproteobacteria bacterium]
MDNSCPIAPGFIVAAPSSGSGKTTITMILIQGLKEKGLSLGTFKVGPDYIDPEFHKQIIGHDCYNLDLWAMTKHQIDKILYNLSCENDLIIGEGVMGLFDNMSITQNSTADVSLYTGLPILLVIDGKGMGQSIAALIQGFLTYKKDLKILGVIINNAKSDKHITIIKQAIDPLNIPIVGFIPYDEGIKIPSRHLGLHYDKKIDEDFLETLSKLGQNYIDFNLLQQLISNNSQTKKVQKKSNVFFNPWGQSVALAYDQAFSFVYPSMIHMWQDKGIEIKKFSPLNNEPPPNADTIYLPGGYPELYLKELSNNYTFSEGLRKAAYKGLKIYGECGGYMVMGRAIIDQHNNHYSMTGLFDNEFSFVEHKLHLGYRTVEICTDTIFGKKGTRFRGHEFHYANYVTYPQSNFLFQSYDSYNKDLGLYGQCRGNILGSFIHIIDRIDD